MTPFGRGPLPYYPLGYRGNPFGTLTRAEWASLAVLTAEIEAALDSGAFHLQMIGEKGHGKTSTLMALEARFRHEGAAVTYERVPAGSDRFHADLAGLDVLLLDEVQRLRRSERRRLRRAALAGLRLIIGTHEDLRPVMARRGVPLTSICLHTLPFDHIRRIIDDRLAFFALPGAAARVTVPDDVLRQLLAEEHDSIRAVQDRLYHAFNAVGEPRPLLRADVASSA